MKLKFKNQKFQTDAAKAVSRTTGDYSGINVPPVSV